VDWLDSIDKDRWDDTLIDRQGNAIACSFAKEGAKGVALIDIQDEKTFNEGKAKVEQYGAEVGNSRAPHTQQNYYTDHSKCLAIRCDVTKEDQVERAVKETVEKFGRIDYAA
jgi:NAD(P)-dependent dehydrogenase (short-subunit alcohol dehydrogenase family)